MAEAILHRVKMSEEERRKARCESSKKYYHANKELAQARHAEWLKANRERTLKSHREWLKANAERVKAYAKARYAGDPEKYKAMAKAWFDANLGRSRARTAEWQIANPEKVKALLLAWRAAHPERYRIYDENRRVRKVKNGGKLSHGLVVKLFKLQRGKCACCGRSLGERYHLDHRVPLALGGANVDSNMQLLRQRCNQEKHAKDPIAFMQSRGFLL